jgi:hypothetical protein
MRLNEFELSQAVQFHDELNPALWKNERLQTEVRRALLRIADHFKEFLGIDNYDLVDITISGSNAAYTYTPSSDIDLHLVVMIPDAHEDELRQLFDAKKYQYNDTHDIKVRGFDVELYVQDVEQAHHSMGIYSVKEDRWVSKPKRQRADIDDMDVREKYSNMKHRIDQAIISQDLDRATAVWSDVKAMRKTGLETAGEFSPENLAFKLLRAQGYLDKIRIHLTGLTDRDLSIDEDDDTPGLPSPPENKSKPEIFLDMDGVLCDFFSEYAKLAGVPPDGSGRYNYRNIPSAKTDPTLNRMIGTDFFSRLPKFPTTDALVSTVTKLFGHYNICSSPLRGDHANSEEHKRIWLQQNLSIQPRDIIITSRKEKHATQPDGTPNILIDDRGTNIVSWRSKGGIGIKYQADEDSLNVVIDGLRDALKQLSQNQQGQ